MKNTLLISLVKSRPFLYDTEDKRYSDLQVKNLAWRDIGRQMNLPGKQCKRLWSQLRDCYRRAMRRQKDKRMHNDRGTVRRWKYEDELAFLNPHLRERPNLYSSLVDDDQSNDSEFPQLQPIAENTNVTSHRSEQTNCAQPTQSAVRRFRMVPRRMLRKPEDNSNFLIVKHMLDQKSDEIETFFSSLAATVRRFPPRLRAIAKAEAFSVISKMEMDYFGGSPIDSVFYPEHELDVGEEMVNVANGTVIKQDYNETIISDNIGSE